MEDWAEVFFSDETMIRQFCQWVIVLRPPCIRYLQRYVLKTVKHPISIMIWSCISRNGRSQLKIYKPGVHVNGEIYERLLRERLQNEMLNIIAVVCMILVIGRVEFIDFFERTIFSYWIGQQTVRISTP